jgi:light-regulated signal transduction histidine kinase (bacteriophytochrome)/ActR/RegA family two-component response regulator
MDVSMIDPNKIEYFSSDEELKEALKTCENEPIHIPGTIQPYGVLFILDKSSYRILGVSENVSEAFGKDADELFGQPISNIIGEEHAHHLEDTAQSRPLTPLRTFHLDLEGKPYDANAHHAEGRIILELEPVLDVQMGDISQGLYNEVRKFAIELRQAENLETLFDSIVQSVRELTGFDRVKLYRFDPDWHGEVIAEARGDDVPSYHGLHFPSADIPRQARELYAKNYLRLIPTIYYKPAQILWGPEMTGEEPVDLSYSVLRNVSPVHLQYLENMGVGASMSISVIQDDRLWGLIACHHLGEKYIPYRQRMLAELMGHIFSSLLSSFEEIEQQEVSETRKIFLEKLSSTLEVNKNIDTLFGTKIDMAEKAMLADGMAYSLNGEIKQYGAMKDIGNVEPLFQYLRDHYPAQIYKSHNVGSELETIKAVKDIEGGLLAVPISPGGKDLIVWYRKPKVQKVNWAGKPEKNISETKGEYRLAPRSSFSLWQQEVKESAQPWSNEDIKTAMAVVSIILEHERSAANFANRAKTEFLTNISHELRTPMNAIVGIADIMNNDKSLSEKQRQFMHTLKNSSESLLTLIDDLLDLAKVEANKMQLYEKNFNFSEILEGVRSMMAVKAHEKNIKLNITYPDVKELNFVGDPARLRQILLNLVSNAVKFTQEGFVNIFLKCEHCHESDMRQPVIIEVSDTGIGMDEEKTKVIFDKFTQADSNIFQKYGGTGLGLSIVSSLVDLMNGTIEVKTKKGVGTKLIIELPLKPANKNSKESKRVMDTPSKVSKKTSYQVENKNQPKEKKRILLVEDYEGNIIVAIYFLQDMGFDTYVVNDGAQAIEKMKSEKFDMVLMDVQMPVMDGFEATREIRRLQQEGELYDCPVIGMTAHAFVGDKERCLQAGMDDYISKPFSNDDLKEVLFANLQE